MKHGLITGIHLVDCTCMLGISAGAKTKLLDNIVSEVFAYDEVANPSIDSIRTLTKRLYWSCKPDDVHGGRQKIAGSEWISEVLPISA